MSESLTYSLNLTLVGISIVFIVLAGISATVALMRRIDDALQRRQTQRDTAKPAPDQSIDELTLVLISAAVATLLTGRHHIRSVRRILSDQHRISSWSMEGRAILHGSHQISKKSPPKS